MQYQIIEQANGKYSVYTDTHADSMADETLEVWDIDTYEKAQAYVDGVMSKQ